ncbi:DUF2779 domain-containing protein [Selenomonas sp. KH1T6]|uniref:DUF2779 domain-containing protein n=1 Tax=Selenomonas sp. KH1T6 TaxID=3158784 RepID=UPI0008A766B2|nr:protein of unknown function [Selenomonas ruminantium]
MNLSKTKYCCGVQCPKMLWLHKNNPDAFDQSTVKQSVYDTGNEVGNYAKSLFGEYEEVPYGNYPEMIATTDKMMADEVPNICEASFSFEGLFCRVDILRNLGDKNVEIYEVKSSTKLNDIYFHDISFQCYILDRLGYHVRRACLVNLDSSYVRHGELDLQKLFNFNDMTDSVMNSLNYVEKNIHRFDEYMKQENEPIDDIGYQCSTPYKCGFWAYCTRNLPRPNCFDIHRVQEKTKFKLYYKGLISFEDILTAKELDDKHKMPIEHEVKSLPPYIDKTAILHFLEGLNYPLYFLDFETFSPAVPIYDNSRPYDRLVFQYSLHYIQTKGGELRHKEFLASPDEDPRRKAAERLCEDIPSDSCVLAYNMVFEQGCIKNLAELYPDLRSRLMEIHDNIQDLMTIFKNREYYTAAMHGSYSIKYVLPALFPNDPDFDYKNLEGVQNGEDASQTFLRMAIMSESEREIHRKQLLQYCKLDTLAMVKIWQKLQEVVQQEF